MYFPPHFLVPFIHHAMDDPSWWTGPARIILVCALELLENDGPIFLYGQHGFPLVVNGVFWEVVYINPFFQKGYQGVLSQTPVSM